jgi:beta-exotoxin I transport system permease protein
MLRNAFTKALWDARRSLPTWAVAIAAVGAMYAAFWPTMNTPSMQQAMRGYPKAVLEAINYNDLASPAGYLGSSVYGLLIPLLVAVFAIGYGTRAVAGDEEAGTLDLLLAYPIGRTRLALHRFVAMIAAMVLIGVVLWLAMLAVSGPARLTGISAVAFGATTLQLGLFGLWYGALAFAVGAATGRRVLALGATSAVAVLGYLANGVFPQLNGLKWTRSISPWHWYLGGQPLRNGLQAEGSLLLLGTALALVVAGTWLFNRRDLAV